MGVRFVFGSFIVCRSDGGDLGVGNRLGTWNGAGRCFDIKELVLDTVLIEKGNMMMYKGDWLNGGVKRL